MQSGEPTVGLPLGSSEDSGPPGHCRAPLMASDPTGSDQDGDLKAQSQRDTAICSWGASGHCPLSSNRGNAPFAAGPPAGKGHSFEDFCLQKPREQRMMQVTLEHQSPEWAWVWLGPAHH